MPNTKIHLHTSSESITDSPRSGEEKTNNARQTLRYSHLCYAWHRTEPQYPAGRPCGLVCMGSGEEVAEILHAMQSSVGTSGKCIATMRHCLTISSSLPLATNAMHAIHLVYFRIAERAGRKDGSVHWNTSRNDRHCKSKDSESAGLF